MIKALAVDPGKITGYVLVDMETGHEKAVATVDKWGELERSEFLDLAWETMISEPYLTHVVVEKFVFRPGRVTTPQYDHSEILGTLWWMCNHLAKGNMQFHTQLVSDAKKYGTAERLKPYRADKGVGYGGDGHALMALSHALLFCETSWDGT